MKTMKVAYICGWFTQGDSIGGDVSLELLTEPIDFGPYYIHSQL